MLSLSRENNKRFYVSNNHLFYYDNECMIYLGEERQKEYWEDDKIRMYRTGVLFTENYGYEKVSRMVFFGNDGRRLFSIDTDNLPYDVNLYKAKADNIHALVFDCGVLVSMRNIYNQCKYTFYFYDKTFLTSYDFKTLMDKVEILNKPQTYTEMILKQLESPENENEQTM